ncbi:MAG TPA: asparagine synthase (glutamine-hydrolyzing) [Gemmatimonadaceae bacterium]|jgi:asparagine synthase (glutamine-hydrolysing)|nr:asparagine synthase (glutamine-hydrolyzing) [Gemmatimonadaceae bacterium]
MCGICGVVSPDPKSTVDRCEVIRMRDVITHRGPDDSGLFIAPGVGLGHRRLSIVDVAGGHQPMEIADGALQIVYNGEVFNHASIRADLEARGHRYQTRCDTESVLRAYAEYGEASPRHLRGMFAYAIWDERTRTLFLARDRFGVKPLYYATTPDGRLYFASEIKAILASGAVRPALNLGALPDYLANHAPSGDETLFAGVRRLPPGHTLTWKDGHIRIARYWDLELDAPEVSRSERELVAEYRERLREAVRMRLMADVPLGVFLSGGIDSATITALMSELVSEPIKTFSVAFAEREANELEYARLVATRFRTDHHEVVVTPREFFDALPTLLWHEDEPIAHPSSIALNFVSRLAARHVKVVLTGEGSDESLAGYGRYRATIYNERVAARYERWVPAAARAAMRRSIQALPAGSRFRQRAQRTFLTLPGGLESLYFDNFAVFSRSAQATLLSHETRAELGAVDPYAAAKAALGRANGAPLLSRLLYADTKTYLHELLMKQDQMSMAASIESRVPFLDHPLVEFATRLPPRLKLRGLTTKYVLRQAMRDTLPPEILTRKKMGFPVPIDAWFRGSFRPIVDELVLGPRTMERGLFEPAALRALVADHDAGTARNGQRLWSLINLELWHRIFLDGESPADIRI